MPAHLVLLVVLEVALEPFDMAVVFEGEDMRGDTVEKLPAQDNDYLPIEEAIESGQTTARRLNKWN